MTDAMADPDWDYKYMKEAASAWKKCKAAWDGSHPPAASSPVMYTESGSKLVDTFLASLAVLFAVKPFSWPGSSFQTYLTRATNPLPRKK